MEEAAKAKKVDFDDEKKMVKKEFQRVCKEMEKTDPATDKYYKLSESLYKLKSVISFWDD